MKSILFLVLVAAALSFPLRAETLTYSDLCNRISDLQHLATPPGPGEKTSLASSYDRGSKYDAANDKYINWGANGDGNFGGDANRTMEGDKVVLMDVKGPGVIWRTWSATPQDGHIRIYLDGETAPAVDLPFTEFFSGKSAPFNRPQLCYQTKANGFNCYVPIPFQKSCKILADPNWGNYYHFNYTQYSPTTKLPPSSCRLQKKTRRRSTRRTANWRQAARIPTASATARRLRPFPPPRPPVKKAMWCSLREQARSPR